MSEPRFSALQREELKYAHLSRRESEAVRANREYLAGLIAAIEAEGTGG